jgi:hypothetical protein
MAWVSEFLKPRQGLLIIAQPFMAGDKVQIEVESRRDD